MSAPPPVPSRPEGNPEYQSQPQYAPQGQPQYAPQQNYSVPPPPQQGYPQQYPPQQQQYTPQPYSQQQQQQSYPQYAPQQGYAQQPMYSPQPGVTYVQPNQPYMQQPMQPTVILSPNAGMMQAPNAAMAVGQFGAAALGMAAPPAPAGTPPGLEYFSVLDHIWVKEMPQAIEQFTSVELNQKYQCLNNQGLQIYWAQENTDCCTRQCCGSRRPFNINIHDPTGKQVMTLTRPLRCNSAWCCCILPINCCFLQAMDVLDISHNLLGRVIQRFTLYGSWFDLQDETGHTLASIRGPYCTWVCFGDVNFDILTGGAGPVGTVTKKWGGLIREDFLSNADNFACVFPMDLPIKTKALIFASTFLIDYMFFEDRHRRQQDMTV